MTGNDAIRLAREAGFNLGHGSPSLSKCLRFAALVAAAERKSMGEQLLMGDCMAMVHNDLLDMGIIEPDVPPMMIPEAIARRDAYQTARVLDGIVAEREACAHACEQTAVRWGFHAVAPSAALDCAKAIRARGEQ